MGLAGGNYHDMSRESLSPRPDSSGNRPDCLCNRVGETMAIAAGVVGYFKARPYLKLKIELIMFEKMLNLHRGIKNINFVCLPIHRCVLAIMFTNLLWVCLW